MERTFDNIAENLGTTGTVAVLVKDVIKKVMEEVEKRRVERLQEKYSGCQIYKIPFYVAEGISLAYTHIGRSSTTYFESSGMAKAGKVFIEIPQMTFGLTASGATRRASLEGLVYDLGLIEDDDLPTPDPVSVVMAIDNSGSMKGEKITDVQKASEIFISLLDKHDRVALMSFNSSAKVLSPLADISKKGHKTNLVSTIQRITAGGGTEFGPPFAEAAQILSNASRKKLILFLSDGNAKFPEAQVVRLIEMGVPTCTIGFGSDCNKQILTQIASRTNGHFYPADRISLPQVFAQISGRSQGLSDLLLKRGIIKQDDQIWEKIVLPSLVDTLTLVLNWQGSDLGFLLETPDGTLITSDNYNSMSGIESINFPEKHSRILKIHGVEAGIWRIGVDALDVPSEGEAYTLTASCSGVEPIVIQPFAPEYSSTSKVPIAITLPNNFLSNRNNVKATISTPRGYKEKLALQDDGTNADLISGDGTFSGWYDGEKSIGFYDVEYEIENSLKEAAPIWLANASFQVGAFLEIRINKVALDKTRGPFQRMLQMIRDWTEEARELKFE